MIWAFCCSFFEKNNIIKPKMVGMNFLFFFFEKNDIIKPQMDGMSFLFFFFRKEQCVKQINLILINKITSQ